MNVTYLISVGYGKDQSGYMAMSFGPLSADGGERRLNAHYARRIAAKYWFDYRR
jgi:hypothetical protein